MRSAGRAGVAGDGFSCDFMSETRRSGFQAEVTGGRAAQPLWFGDEIDCPRLRTCRPSCACHLACRGRRRASRGGGTLHQPRLQFLSAGRRTAGQAGAKGRRDRHEPADHLLGHAGLEGYAGFGRQHAPSESLCGGDGAWRGLHAAGHRRRRARRRRQPRRQCRPSHRAAARNDRDRLGDGRRPCRRRARDGRSGPRRTDRLALRRRGRARCRPRRGRSGRGAAAGRAGGRQRAGRGVGIAARDAHRYRRGAGFA